MDNLDEIAAARSLLTRLFRAAGRAGGVLRRWAIAALPTTIAAALGVASAIYIPSDWLTKAFATNVGTPQLNVAEGLLRMMAGGLLVILQREFSHWRSAKRDRGELRRLRARETQLVDANRNLLAGVRRPPSVTGVVRATVAALREPGPEARAIEGLLDAAESYLAGEAKRGDAIAAFAGAIAAARSAISSTAIVGVTPPPIVAVPPPVEAAPAPMSIAPEESVLIETPSSLTPPPPIEEGGQS